MNKKKLNCILLIDDDEPTNFISTMVLEEAGCTRHIQIAQSGRKALEYLSKSDQCGIENNTLINPELIFPDINMPAMSGWEFLEEYGELKNGRHPETVVIVLTSSINPNDKLKAENIPLVDGFMNKPLTSTMIESVIKKYFVNGQVLKYPLT